ncbi:MAG: DUF2505 domain-containing protein [Burkholderiaceae bacterium]
MKFEIAQVFPTGLARLWEALGRRDYVEQKYIALGSTSVQINQFDSSPQRIEVRLDRTLPIEASGLPAWARWLSVRPPRLTHHTCWTRVGTKQVDVELRVSTQDHAVDADGTGTVIEEDSGRSRMRLSVTVRCPVPAVGEQIAKVFADQMKRALEQDHTFTVRYLMRDATRPADAATRTAGTRRRGASGQ